MIDSLEYCGHCDERETFIAAMLHYSNPLHPSRKLAETDAEGNPIFGADGQLVMSDGIRLREVGVVKKNDGYDAEGMPINERVVNKFHFNLAAVGDLYRVLIANGGWEAIMALIGEVEWVEEEGVPGGWRGTSGLTIYPASAIPAGKRVDEWC